MGPDCLSRSHVGFCCLTMELVTAGAKAFTLSAGLRRRPHNQGQFRLTPNTAVCTPEERTRKIERATANVARLRPLTSRRRPNSMYHAWSHLKHTAYRQLRDLLGMYVNSRVHFACPTTLTDVSYHRLKKNCLKMHIISLPSRRMRRNIHKQRKSHCNIILTIQRRQTRA